MKTVTLTDEAYDRLKSWKDETKNSFSKVVLETVPKRGTFGDFLKHIDKLPPFTDEMQKIFDECRAWDNDPKNSREPWTTL